MCSVASVMSDSLRPFGLGPTRLLCPWNSPGRNTGGGCHALLKGTFLTRGLNSHLSASPALQADSLTTELSGKPIGSIISKYSDVLSLGNFCFNYASLCLTQDTACLGLVHGDDPERCYGEEGGRGVHVWEHMYTHGGFKSMYGKTNTIL